jgi:hypothetical protein
VQIKPDAKPMRYFICSTLKSDHIGRRNKNSGQPIIRKVLANRHFHTARTDLAGDHIGKLRCTDTLLTYREAPQVQSAPRAIKAKKISTIHEEIWFIDAAMGGTARGPYI